jgi:hypothetical protein
MKYTRETHIRSREISNKAQRCNPSIQEIYKRDTTYLEEEI